MDKTFASGDDCDKIHSVKENAAKERVELSSTLREYVKNKPVLKRLFSFALKLTQKRHLKHLGGAAILLPMFLFWTGMMPHGVIRAQDANIVSVYADGEKQVFATDADTVQDALSRVDVEVDENDLVEPAIDTPINSSSFNINVYRSRPVLVTVGDKDIVVETAYQSPRLVAKAAGLDVYPEDIVELERIEDFTSSALVGTRVKIIPAKRADIAVDGLSLEVRSHAKTVEEVLHEKGIELNEEDIVKPGLSASFENNSDIRVIRVGNKVVTEEEPVGFGTRYVTDYNLPVGARSIKTAGKTGKRVVTYEVTLHDGKVAKKKAINSKVVTQPVEQVVVKGGKVFSPDSNVALAQQMAAARGWTGSQWTALYNLLSHEANFNHLAVNPTSGACGIPQALPCSKMATHGSDYRTNPATQIAWGLDYIANRYGTPLGAWNFWLTNNWY